MLDTQEESASGANVAQDRIEFSATPSTRTRPGRCCRRRGPAQVTIPGRWPILSDFSWRQVDDDRPEFPIVCRTDGNARGCVCVIRPDYGPCMRAYISEALSRGQMGGFGAFWRACSESRLVNVPSRLMTVKRRRRGPADLLRKDRAAKKKRRATAVTDNMLIRGCLSTRGRWSVTNELFPAVVETLKLEWCPS